MRQTLRLEHAEKNLLFMNIRFNKNLTSGILTDFIFLKTCQILQHGRYIIEKYFLQQRRRNIFKTVHFAKLFFKRMVNLNI
jgi:hypothetical protein